MRTTAEWLLNLARSLRADRDKLLIPEGPLTETDYARIKLALKVLDNPALAFGLIVDGSNLQEVIRKIY